MALGRTAPLRRELESALPRRPFSLRFWDGAVVDATEPEAPTFTFRSPRRSRTCCGRPGSWASAVRTSTGLLEVDDLDARCCS